MTSLDHRWPVRIGIGLRTRVLEAVAIAFEVPVGEIVSERRQRDVVIARQAAMTIWVGMGLSTPQAGRWIGRDHSTVVHGIRAIAWRTARDLDLAGRLGRARRMVESTASLPKPMVTWPEKTAVGRAAVVSRQSAVEKVRLPTADCRRPTPAVRRRDDDGRWSVQAMREQDKCFVAAMRKAHPEREVDLRKWAA